MLVQPAHKVLDKERKTFKRKQKSISNHVRFGVKINAVDLSWDAFMNAIASHIMLP
jgi:hypothetical protein